MDVTAKCEKCGYLMVEHQPHGKELLCPELVIPLLMTWGDYYREAKAAGMDDASACHAADTAVP